jgi:hypothetical protein
MYGHLVIEIVPVFSDFYWTFLVLQHIELSSVFNSDFNLLKILLPPPLGEQGETNVTIHLADGRGTRK